METPQLVSVVIPCFNQQEYVGDAIESVQRQTYKAVEVVVVDDGSDDNSADVIRSYPGVRYLRQDNHGLARARNAGLEASTGTFVVFLDADDWLLRRAVELGVQALSARPECMFAAGHYVHVLPTGRVVPKPAVALAEGAAYRELLAATGFTIAHGGSVVYRRSVFEAVGGFDPRWDAAADYDLYLRIARSYMVCAHARPTAAYRVRPESMSQNPDAMMDAVLEVHAAQRAFVEGDAELTAAYNEGRRFWREYYGWQCLHAVGHDVREWQLRRAARRMVRASRALLPHVARRLVEPRLGGGRRRLQAAR
jgi:cellulose synthase/poly-beta-1,6-N-acetylglucosamine synthase-like glycosyltransferase